MSRTGRPTKLTPEIQQKIVAAIAAGNYIETSAALVGIDRTTLQRWMKRGARAESGKHHEFCIAVEKALAQAEARDVAVIGKAATKHWQAAAWRLERKNQQRWGRKAMIVTSRQEVEDALRAFKDIGDFASIRRIANGEDALLVMADAVRKRVADSAKKAD